MWSEKALTSLLQHAHGSQERSYFDKIPYNDLGIVVSAYTYYLIKTSNNPLSPPAFYAHEIEALKSQNILPKINLIAASKAYELRPKALA